MDTIFQVLTFVFGGTSVIGTITSIVCWRQTKRLKKAEAKQKEAEADKTETEANEAEDHRFTTLLQLVDSLTSRLSSLNDSVDKHIDRNRELSDRLYKSETELNHANERIIKLTEGKESERALKEHYKLWHCRKEGCTDRMPPNEKLNGLKYEHPKRAVK